MDALVFADDKTVLNTLVYELRLEYPPVEDSLAELPWTCKHDVTFPDWYVKEVFCTLTHE